MVEATKKKWKLGNLTRGLLEWDTRVAYLAYLNESLKTPTILVNPQVRLTYVRVQSFIF